MKTCKVGRANDYKISYKYKYAESSELVLNELVWSRVPYRSFMAVICSLLNLYS